jgi:hypothetical protein
MNMVGKIIIEILILWVYEGIIDGMKCYTAEQIETALKAAGFSKVSSDHHPSKPWITVIARN